MRPPVARLVQGQAGYTLIELIVASAISVALLTGLTSVVLTTWRASVIATNRIEAGSEIRNFQLAAYDDFARSAVPGPSSCNPSDPGWSGPCTRPIILSGTQVSNSTSPVPASLQVTYTWDGTAVLDRQVAGNPAEHTALNVTSFSWYVDSSAGHSTVVVNLTITIGNPTTDPVSYSESQTLRFYPRLT